MDPWKYLNSPCHRVLVVGLQHPDQPQATIFIHSADVCWDDVRSLCLLQDLEFKQPLKLLSVIDDE